MSNELKKCSALKETNVSYAASTAVNAAVLGAHNVNSAMSTIDALRQQLADVSHERDGLRAERDQLVTCGIELERGLRIIATANVKTRAPDLRLKAKQTLSRAMSGASTEQQVQS